MRAFALKRLALAIPLLVVVSFLTFSLSKLAGGSYFDQFKTDRRYDPAQIRLWEREAHLDRPLLGQFAYWLRGVCFDIQYQAPRARWWGFEAPLDSVPSRGTVSDAAGWIVQRSGEETIEGIRSLRIRAVEPEGPLRLTLTPAPDLGDGLLRRVELAALLVGEPGVTVGWVGTPRLDLPKGGWHRLELEVPGDGIAVLEVHAAAGSELFLDDLAVVGPSRALSVGKPDFGRSFYYDTPVFELLLPHLLNSTLLALLTLAFTFSVAIPLGTYCAVHRGQWTDRMFSVLTFMGMSVPGFFLALLALYFSVEVLNDLFAFPLLPIGSARSADYESFSAAGRVFDRLWHLILPVAVLSAGSIAAIQRVTRGNLLEVLRQNYVTTARAKGLPENRVVYRHALRNAVNPLVMIFGTHLAELLSGAALVEIVFQYPGMGKFVLQATIARDLYVVMGSVLLGSLILVLANLAADLLLALLDPRVDYSGGAGR